MSVPDPGDWSAQLERWPTAPWWIGPSGCLTRNQVLVASRDVARQLSDRGWRPGQRLALEAATEPSVVTLLLAALAAGIDVILLPLRELPARRRELAERAAAAGIVTVAAHGLTVPVATAQMPDEPATSGRVWLRSSGSLGRPRWVVHDATRLLATGGLGAQALDFAPGSAWQCALALDHAGGLAPVFRALAGGGALVAPATDAKVTHLSLVPTQLARGLAGGDSVRLRDLAVLLLGGAPLSPGLRRRASDAGLPLVVSYGLTESGGMLAAGRDRVRESGWAGRPLPGWRAAVGEDGELLIAGPGLCAGIAADDGVVTAPTRRDGWLATGDLGSLDDDGGLVILGRRDNVMISGGEKLPAEELEGALLDLAGVEDAVVVPIADPEWGQRPAAFVRFAAGRERPLARLREDLGATIAAWKLPVALWPLPPSAGLKPDRAALAALAASRRS